MNLEEMKLGELQKLFAVFGNSRKETKEINGGIRIVILQRGWVAVGKYFRKGSQSRLEQPYIIRKWGTTEGLGEIAMKGPLSGTVLDKSPTIEFHQLTEVANIHCVEDKWSGKFLA